MHAPHPPSKHINLVPFKFACSRIKVFNEVSIGTLDGETEIELQQKNCVNNQVLSCESHY